MEEKALISKKTLTSLVRDSLELQSLSIAGVDNWEGCEFADEVTDEQVDEEVAKLTGGEL